MKKEVTIVINTESIGETGEPDHISVTAKGTVLKKDGLFYISYNENPEEFGKTLTTIKVKNDRVELIRTGNVSSKLIFIKNQPFNSSYNTPYGSLPLKLSLIDMTLATGDCDGQIFLHYNLDLAGNKTENKFTLKYN